MTRYYFLAITLLSFWSGIGQIVNIPDPIFKALITTQDINETIARDENNEDIIVDINNDGEIQQSEALAVYNIFSQFDNIQSWEGIEFFVNLTFFASSNDLTSLDLTPLSNLEFIGVTNTLPMTINVAGLSNVTELRLGSSKISSLDLTGLDNLVELVVSNNPNLTDIDASNKVFLDRLLGMNSGLTNINVDGCTSLTQLLIYGNELTTLTVANLPILDRLDCRENLLHTINATNLPVLENLNARDNLLVNLNLSGLGNLKALTLSNNSLIQLDVSPFQALIGLDCSNNMLSSLTLSNPLLTTLNCQQNDLTTLDLTATSIISDLIANDNQISSLDLGISTEYLNMELHNNELTEIDLSGQSNLQSLRIYGNLITSLDLSETSALEELFCAGLDLTELQVSHLTNLVSLWAQAVDLTEINLSGLSNLEQLVLTENSIEILDFTELTNLNYFIVRQNPLLEAILLKEGNNIGDFVEADLTNNTSLVYVCADDFEISEMQSILNSQGYGGTVNVNTFCTFSPGGEFYTIEGNARFDFNSNGCDISDQVVPHLKLEVSNSSTSGFIFSDSQGYYNIPVQEGSYTIEVETEAPDYFTLDQTGFSVSFPSDPSPVVQDFCFVPNGVHPDLEVTLMPVGVARPGFDADYKILYKNKGNQIQSGEVRLVFNDVLTDFVSSAPAASSQNQNIILWDYTDLVPFESREIFLTVNVNAPTDNPPVNIGDELGYDVTIFPVDVDETPTDNQFELKQIVVGSFDPNDKRCLQGETIELEMVGEYVHYLIRFENTGTFPAENIVIKDLIDTQKFQLETLRPLDGSHEFMTRLNSNVVEYIFEGINLPFEEGQNQGYVLFKIKTKEDLIIGDVFTNDAEIFFDFNFPIETNLTETEVVEILGTPDFDFESAFTIFPNPVESILNIRSKKDDEITSVEVYSLTGQLTMAIPVSTERINVSSLANGTYFIKINTIKGSAHSKFIKK